MIKSIRLKFGSAQGMEHAEFNTTPVTVFVGPNNSGKSKVLLEIHRFCSQGTKVVNDLILDEIVFEEFTLQLAEENIKNVTLEPNKNETVRIDHVLVGKRGTRKSIPEAELLNALQHPNDRPQYFCPWFLSYNTIILDGENRINLIREQIGGDLQQPPQSSLQVLFRDDIKRKEVRRIIHDAFNSYFIIDPTNLGQLRIKLSKREPATDFEERGIHEDAVKYHAEAISIENTSDGVKAFTGIITEIIAGDPKVLLIDEPEAFLHPSLSYKLGKEVAHASAGTDKRIFVSTHSSNFVMGCIQSGTPINIVRLTYMNEQATARVLPNEKILRLMRNPLLRSTRVLEGLFFEFVIVTESDTDRAFYQEVNERLLAYKPSWGISNCLFINAQNKQTIKTILKPLRSLGIPTSAIVDIDVIKEGGSVWTGFLESCFIPDISSGSLSHSRATIKNKLESTGNNMKRGGLELLHETDKEAGNNFFNQLEEYGLFVVRKGELESWLPSLGSSGHGPNWLIETFEKMGEDPASDSYIKPSDNDVWEFMSRLKVWFSNPEKKGIPT